MGDLAAMAEDDQSGGNDTAVLAALGGECEEAELWPSLDFAESSQFLGYEPSETRSLEADSQLESAWYKDVAIKADSSGDAASAAKTADTRGSPNDESWGNITSLVRAAHQRLEVTEPKHVWESGFWKSIFEPSTDPFRDFFTEQIGRPAQPSGTSLQIGEESSPARMVARQAGRGSFLQAVKNREVVAWKAKREEQLQEALGRGLNELRWWLSSCLCVKSIGLA